ncbi:helix-turn-helix transcriptional regulator [Solwaraspora sp. WMMD1047]|uniref:helix-turn-helix domain-containing protein n=1 Tax=Solwaraspora sp. WMMD1047 TaxID=3016102 RepID=UPI002415FBB8|nr:helix-turn-helix transcriptional regulator [Solwaraspora sp. WMMD1047]MDG4829862.1 helix-turn-helix transcriptional regulator [Solwaraspora sp. WMMD1047]
MLDVVGSTVPRRQLGRYLQQRRTEGNLSVQRVCAELDCSPQKLWRIESGLATVKVPDVRALCEVYAIGPEMTKLLVDLAKQGSPTGWWQAYDDIVPDWFEPYLVLESSADRLRHYDTELVHGLLQTVRYMTEVIKVGRPELSEEKQHRRVELRQQRQKMLGRSGPLRARMEFILSEAVLRRPIRDHAAMADQLRYLAEINELPDISVRVLPLSVGPHAASVAGSFAVLDFPQPRRQDGDPPVVYQEGPTGALYLDRPVEIALFDGIWQALTELALSERESSDIIYSFAGERR